MRRPFHFSGVVEAVTCYALPRLRIPSSHTHLKIPQGFFTNIDKVGDWQLVLQGRTIVLECLDEAEGTSHCEVSICSEKKRHVEMVMISGYIKKHQEGKKKRRRSIRKKILMT